MSARLDQLARDLGLPTPFPSLPYYDRIADAIAMRRAETRAPLLAGICGPQGSGKSTMAAFVAALLDMRGVPTAILSLDDLYLNPEDRPVDVHPLFITRGVPGTHDIALGLGIIDRLFGAGPEDLTPIPRFDKACDRRAPQMAWDRFSGPAAVVLLEGWCVGATPQDDVALAAPVNRLEAEEDPERVWRRHVNACLAGDYQDLFGRIDVLVYLEAPSFDCVSRWRALQEHKLRAREGEDAGMGEAALGRFVMHYERITHQLAATLPTRADILVELDTDQRIAAMRSLVV